MFLHRPPIRRFGFQTYYYNPDNENQEKTHRIKFKRILRSPKPVKKPIRRWVIFLIGLLFFLWYFHGIDRPQDVVIEDITIEDVSPR